MAMTIEEAIKQLETYTIPCGKYKAAYDLAVDTMRKYQMMQADYENRLKADMVAMLTELKEELREMHEDYFEAELFDEAFGVSESMDVIQQKINSLKAESKPHAEKEQTDGK